MYCTFDVQFSVQIACQQYGICYHPCFFWTQGGLNLTRGQTPRAAGPLTQNCTLRDKGWRAAEQKDGRTAIQKRRKGRKSSAFRPGSQQMPDGWTTILRRKFPSDSGVSVNSVEVKESELYLIPCQNARQKNTCYAILYRDATTTRLHFRH